MKCASCSYDNQLGQKFCGNCGAQIEQTALDASVLSAIDARILATLQERFRDQKTVELEVAQAVVTRLFDWSKFLGLAAAVPLAILIATLAIWGISSFLDFHKKVDAGRAQITDLITKANTQVGAITKANTQVGKALQDAQVAVQKTQKEAQALRDQLSLARKQLGTLPTDVKTLQTKFTQLDQETALKGRFGNDENTALLRNFWLPNGKANPIHQKALRDWLDANGMQDLSITFFLNAEHYADARKKAVAALVK